jgi:hypothetical protein
MPLLEDRKFPSHVHGARIRFLQSTFEPGFGSQCDSKFPGPNPNRKWLIAKILKGIYGSSALQCADQMLIFAFGCADIGLHVGNATFQQIQFAFQSGQFYQQLIQLIFAQLTQAERLVIAKNAQLISGNRVKNFMDDVITKLTKSLKLTCVDNH